MNQTNENKEIQIYQLKQESSTRGIRFESLETIQNMGKEPTLENYELVYKTDTSILKNSISSAEEQLDLIYVKFNLECPDDYHAHSLSVSDVVVLNQKAYYVDSVGFQKLPNFLPDAEVTMSKEEVLDQLYSLIDNAKSFLDEKDPDEIWVNDIKALHFAIDAIQKYEKELFPEENTKKPLKHRNRSMER